MPKLPRLDEVFISHRQPINVGSAYSLKREASTPSSSKKMREASDFDKLRPELEKVLATNAEDIMLLFKETAPGEVKEELMAQLRRMAHELEGAEGEDPKELDPNGPEPGTTGGK